MVGHFCSLEEIVCHPWKRMLLEKSFGIWFGREEGNVNSAACVPLR